MSENHNCVHVSDPFDSISILSLVALHSSIDTDDRLPTLVFPQAVLK